MLDDLLRRRGVRDKVEIIYTYPTVSQLLRNCLFLQRDTCEILPTVFEQRGIRYQRGFTLSHVDPDAKSPIRKRVSQKTSTFSWPLPHSRSTGRTR